VANPKWTEPAPGVHHLVDGADLLAIVEQHPVTEEWHWRCPAAQRGGTATDATQAKRAARRALREAGDDK
jgi:hypothetical protein